MKISLFNPSSESPDGVANPPIGLIYLHSFLVKDGYDVNVHNYLWQDWSDAETNILSDLNEEHPDVVGVQCMTYNRTAAVKLAKMAKQVFPKCKVVFGGVHATVMYEQLLKNIPDIDFIVMGEGEITFPELIANFDNPKNVKGIAFMKGKEIVVTEPRQQIEDLDILPMLNYELFLDDYKRAGRIHVSSSRGCFFRCLFCSTSHFWKNKWRARSPKHVVDELEMLVKVFPNKTFSFSDDYFTGDKKRVIDICEEIVKRDIKIKWVCDTRIDQLDEELVIHMKKAGCQMLGLGIESGSQKMMNALRKGYKREDVIEKMKMCHKNGMMTATLLIVGTPGETREDIEETKRFFSEVKKDNPHYNNKLEEVYRLWIFPGTPLYERAKSEGIIDDSYWLTEQKVPYYTKEWSYDVLRSRASEIVWHHHRLNGWGFIIRYALRGFVRNPFKFFKYVFERKYLEVVFK